MGVAPAVLKTLQKHALSLAGSCWVQVFDYNLFATATAIFGHLMPDFKRHAKRDKSK
jgi:hypothetical protein